MLHKQRSPASPPVIATLALASPSPRKCLYLKYFFLASVPHQSECGVGRQPMADPSYIFFNKSLLQCRSLGARGGRAYGRNQRARRARIALLPTPPAAVPFPAPPQETTATAIALLDARFPWLRCAERRHSGGTSLPYTSAPAAHRSRANTRNRATPLRGVGGRMRTGRKTP